ncbi:D-lactate dehydrogenase [Klebsiella pneumoniae]|nr:D-lactate dehydrogenase [Klebsiella pneumoniae]
MGHLYEAPESLQQFYRQNDPTNSMNPGIGKTSKQKYWGEAAPTPASPADPQ